MGRPIWRDKVTYTQEDTILVGLIEKYGACQWNKVAEMLNAELDGGNFTQKQCRDRWNNYLHTGLTNKPWTQLEIQLLFKYRKELGHKWVEISKQLPGRGANDVKNKFYSITYKNRRKIRTVAPDTPFLDQPLNALSELDPDLMDLILDYELPGIYNIQNRRKQTSSVRGISAEQIAAMNNRLPSSLPPLDKLREYYTTDFIKQPKT